MIFEPIEREPDYFQQSLTAEEIIAIARSAFGTKTAVLAASEIGNGLFNNTYLLTLDSAEQAILRVAPRYSPIIFDHERRLLQREQSLEPALRHALGDMVPRTLFADFSHIIVDRDYALQTVLPGVVWDEVQEELTDSDQNALYAQLAEMALAIHREQHLTFGLPDPERPYARWSDALIDLANSMHANLLALGISDEGVPPLLDVLEQGRPWLDEIDTPRLVHGDLWPKNVLIDRSVSPPQISGLLDAERGYWGDPQSEWIFTFYDIPEAFWEVYGRLPDTPGQRFRYAAYHGQFLIQVLLECHRFPWDAGKFRGMIYARTAEMATLLGMD